nr:hypothetical protein [uncultured bacterium]
MSIRRSHRARRAFTLLELMVVLVIIGLLGGIVAYNLVGTADKAKADATRQKMVTIKAAVDTFYVQNSRYPTQMGELVQAGLVVGEKTRDAWNRDILLAAPAPGGQYPYALISFGKNGESDGGAGDDIYVYPDSQ